MTKRSSSAREKVRPTPMKTVKSNQRMKSVKKPESLVKAPKPKAPRSNAKAKRVMAGEPQVKAESPEETEADQNRHVRIRIVVVNNERQGLANETFDVSVGLRKEESV